MGANKYLILFLLSSLLTFCGGDGGDDSLKVKKNIEQVPLSEIKTSHSAEKVLKIKDVKFSKLIDVQNDLTAIPVLSDKEAEEEFNFRWFVNDNEIEGENDSSLSSEYFNEDDWVYCRVRIIGEGEEFSEYSSRIVKIMGPLPIVNLDTIENFTPPGIFRYKINAHMPETAGLEPEYGDEDEIDPEKSIKFELISPLDKDIELNTLTGEITWNITSELIEELGKEIIIKFSVISPSGRKVNSSITISLKESENTNNNSNNDSTLGSEIE